MVIGIDGRHLQEKNWSGVGTYTSHLLEALIQHTPHEYVLFSNATKLSRLHADIEGITSVHTRFPNALLHPALRFFKKPQLDVLIEKRAKKIDLFFSSNLHFTSVSARTPHILVIHDVSFELYKECYSAKRQLWHRLVQPKKQCEQAAAIIVPSEHTKNDVARIYAIPREKIHVVYPGIPVAQEEVRDSKRTKQYILFVGTIEPRKNIEGIIHAYIESGLYQQGIELYMAGGEGWKSAHLMRLMRETPGVVYRGYVSDTEKTTLFASALMCVFPSFYEGFGFPVVEAMQAGVPVITSDRSSLPEIAQGAAYMVNPYSIGSIALGMKRLTEDVALRELLVEQGRRVAAGYSWKKSAEELGEIFSRFHS